MSDNPNSRGWRNDRVFVDLGTVAVIECHPGCEYFGADGAKRMQRPFVKIHTARYPNSPIDVRLEPHEQQSLLNALEIYRSNR